MTKYEDSTDTLHEAKKLRLLAAALELHHFTSAETNIVPIPGGDRVIAIGTPAQLRARLADVPAKAAPSVSEQDERALPPLMEAFGAMENADDEGHTIGWVPGYTADQMRMYALAALAAHPAPQATRAEGGHHD